MSTFENYDTYFEAILQRNKEGHTDGHMIVFNYDEDFLKSLKEYFNKCCDRHLSPHKALTFISIEFKI